MSYGDSRLGKPRGISQMGREVELVGRKSEAGKKVLVAGRALPRTVNPRIEVISARPDWVELQIPCTREAAEWIDSFLMNMESDLPDELRRTIGLALRELLLNAVEWGGKLDPNRKVRIAHMRTPRMLLYRVTDPGAGFSFEGLQHASVPHAQGPVTAESIERVAEVRSELGMRPGGFGIALTRAIADELVYNEAQNEVILVKYLTGLADDSGASS